MGSRNSNINSAEVISKQRGTQESPILRKAEKQPAFTVKIILSFQFS